MALAAYNQNHETFRSLNALMWQIPLIAMTLTGGLWFGVSKVEEASIFRIGLLSLAFVGDLGLAVVLQRLRFVMGEHLRWLDQAHPRGHVAAIGTGRLTGSKTVKRVFQAILAFAAIISLVLLAVTMASMLQSGTAPPKTSAVAWYDAHADEIADGYEGLDADVVHRELFQLLRGSPPLRVLDVGAGTGRDATALAALGHRVTAVEPSIRMLKLARALHPDAHVDWTSGSLPALTDQRGPFDLIVASAVWMHVPPDERAAAFRRLTQLVERTGRIYMTLRNGPAAPERGMFGTDPAELASMATAAGMRMTTLASQPDLLGREGVTWSAVVIDRPEPAAARREPRR